MFEADEMDSLEQNYLIAKASYDLGLTKDKTCEFLGILDKLKKITWDVESGHILKYGSDAAKDYLDSLDEDSE
jgi:hypothetical protein